MFFATLPFWNKCHDFWKSIGCLRYLKFPQQNAYNTDIFFTIKVFSHRHWRFKEQQGMSGGPFLLLLPIPPTHEHSDIYLQLRTRDDYHLFSFVEIYYLTELLFEWLMIECQFLLGVPDDLILGFLLQQTGMGNRWI